MLLSLARCSIVDYQGNVLLDVYAKPDSPIADYRTKYSGIRKADMKNALSTSEARQMAYEVLKVGDIIASNVSSCCLILLISFPEI